MPDETTPNIDQKHPRDVFVSRIGKLTAGLVTFLAVAAFGLSFEALRDLAIVAGGMKPQVAWLFPLIVDGGIIVFSLGALRAGVTGGGDQRWFLGLVVVVTLLSVALNVAHAQEGFVAALVASVPPVLLFLAFESLMRQIHDSVAAPARGRKIPARRSSEPMGSLRPVVAQPDRKTQVIEMAARGVSRGEIARTLRMSPATIRRYLQPPSES